MEGFNAPRWINDTGKWTSGIERMRQWHHKNKVRAYEMIIDGFDQLPTAHIDVVGRKNFGIAIIKL